MPASLLILSRRKVSPLHKKLVIRKSKQALRKPNQCVLQRSVLQVLRMRGSGTCVFYSVLAFGSALFSVAHRRHEALWFSQSLRGSQRLLGSRAAGRWRDPMAEHVGPGAGLPHSAQHCCCAGTKQRPHSSPCPVDSVWGESVQSSSCAFMHM